MENEYPCPECGKCMKLDSYKNILSCKNVFCEHQMPLAEYLLSPDIRILLGKTKINGKVIFLTNSKNKKFAIEVDKTDNTYSSVCNFGPFDIDKLQSVQITVDNNIIYENKYNSLPMIAGGILFGSIGAIAGSIITNKKQDIKRKVTYNLILKIEDIHVPAFYIEVDDKDLVYKFINTIELLRSQKIRR